MAREAAGRLLVLVAVARRGFLEQAENPLPAEARAAERFDLVGWLTDERLLALATPAESELLRADIGELSPEAAAEATWALEGVAALAWALNLLTEEPWLTAPAPAAALLAALPATWSRTIQFRDEAELRDEAVIASAREAAEIWAARAQLWYDQVNQDADAAALIRDLAAEAVAAGIITSTLAGDFPVAGRPYAKLPPSEVHDLAMIAEHRLAALDWLCGLAPLADQ